MNLESFEAISHLVFNDDEVTKILDKRPPSVSKTPKIITVNISRKKGEEAIRSYPEISVIAGFEKELDSWAVHIYPREK